MAHYMSIFFIISTLPLLFPMSPLASTLDLPLEDLSQITELQVLGSVTCPITSNLPYTGGSVGVAGVPVTATCDGLTGISPPLQATTDSSGMFFLPITGLNGDALAFQPDQPISCYVTISLPVAGTSCQTFPSTGSLQAPINFDRLVDNVGQLGRLLAIFNAGPFQYTA